MKFLVIGVTGKRGSGKDTVAEYLKGKYGFHVLTYLDHVLAPVLKKEGKEITRENLINLALEMRKKKGNHILTELICEKIGKEGFWAISGIRYPEEYDHFKLHFGDNFKLVNVECGVEKRYERIIRRGTKGEGHLTFEEFMNIDERETESIINKTVEMSDFSVDNSSSVEELRRKVDGLAERLGIRKSL